MVLVYQEKRRKTKQFVYFQKMEVVPLQTVVTIYINEPIPS